MLFQGLTYYKNVMYFIIFTCGHSLLNYAIFAPGLLPRFFFLFRFYIFFCKSEYSEKYPDHSVTVMYNTVFYVSFRIGYMHWLKRLYNLSRIDCNDQIRLWFTVSCVFLAQIKKKSVKCVFREVTRSLRHCNVHYFIFFFE